jgi:hypothetical protein
MEQRRKDRVQEASAQHQQPEQECVGDICSLTTTRFRDPKTGQTYDKDVKPLS